MERKKNTKSIRTIKILALVFTGLSLVIVIILYGLLTKSNYEEIAHFETVYANIKVMWLSLLFLPISIFCLVFGIVFTIKKYRVISNIIVGVIFSVILTWLGTSSFTPKDFDKTNAYWNELSITISIDIPSDLDVLTISYHNEKDYKDDSFVVQKESVARFSSDESLNEYKSSLNDKWLASLNNKVVPSTYFADARSREGSDRFDRYLVFSFNDTTYNPQSVSSGNRYVCISFLGGKKGMYLIEYVAK